MKTLIIAACLVISSGLSTLYANVYEAQRVGEIARYVVPLTNVKLTNIIHLEDTHKNVISINELNKIKKQFGKQSVLIDGMQLNNYISDVELVHIQKADGKILRSEDALYLKRVMFVIKPDQVTALHSIFPNAIFDSHVKCQKEKECITLTIPEKNR